MSDAAPLIRVPVIEEFIAVHRNTLRGFAKVVLPSGMVLVDVGIHCDNGKAWASPASKPMLDRNGAAVRDSDGKIRYVQIIGFATKAVRDRFSASIIDALIESHPDALS